MRILITRLKLVALLATGSALAAPVSRVTNFVDGNVLTASQLNSEFNNVLAGVNSINDAQIASGAAIAPSKISAVIKGTSIARDAGTGALSVKTDNTSIESSGDNLQIKDLGVTTGKIAADAVTSAKIPAGGIATSDIADLAITQGKRIALGQQISAGSGAAGSSSSFPIDITNLSVTITTTGRPVFIGLISLQAGTSAYVSSDDTDSEGSAVIIEFVEGASNKLFHGQFGGKTASGSATDDPTYYTPCSTFSTVAVLAAGTYTLKTTGNVLFSGDSLEVNNCRMIAYEL